MTTSASAGTNGFLFCDLRGYTAYVESHGDQAAADLLATYRKLVRAVIAEHAGAEIRTEGDSVYVVFPTASAGVEAGLAIVAAAAAASTKERPLRVGVGIHAGETVATTEGLVGGAVNVAARVCAKAQAGEVLVTDTVRALTRTFLPYTYTSLGTQSLKGIAGGIPLYRVEASPASRLAHLRRRLVARRRRVAVGALLALVIFAAGSAAWYINRPPDCLALPASTKDVVARIDPARGCVMATYPVGRGPSLAVWAKDKLWVANDDDGTITVLSAAGRPVATVGVGGSITAMAADDTDLWVLDGADGILTSVALDSAGVVGANELPGEGMLASASGIAKVRAAFHEQAFTEWFIEPGGEYGGLAVEPHHVWVSNRRTGQLVLDPPDFPNYGPVPAGYQVETALDALTVACWQRQFDLPQGCSPLSPPDPRPYTSLIAVVGRTVWIAHQLSPDLAVLDLDTGIVTHYTPPGASVGATALAAIGNDIWVAFGDGKVVRRSTESVVAAVNQVATTLAGIAGGANDVWAVSEDDHSVIRVDPDSLAAEHRIDAGGKASGVAVAPDGSVWVTIR